MSKNNVLFSFLLCCSCLRAQVKIETNLVPVIAPSASHTVEVRITKGTISNFAKYQMDFPAGMTVTEGNNLNGNFSFETGRAKIVWVSIPAESEFIISYIVNTGSVTGNITLNHRFYYLEEGAKKDFEPDPIQLKIETGGIASLNPLSSATTSGSAVATTATESGEVIAVNTKTDQPETSKQETQKPETPRSETPKPETPKPETPKSESSLVYRLQLGAFGADPGRSKFSNTGKVDIVKEDGLFKVMLGQFATKEEALKKREELLKNGISTFIAAYKDGKRQK